MNYVSINQRGTAHKNGECEDALFVSQDKTVFCLADGVSNSRYGAFGAKLVVTELGKRFKTLKYKRLLNTGSVEEVRIEICKVIDEVLVLLCKKYNEKINEIESITQKDDSAQSSTELETTSQVFNSGNTTESYHSDESEAVTENNNVHNFQDTYIYN